MQTLLVISMCIWSLSLTTAHWMTQWDKPITFECPRGQILRYIESEHHNKKEDRRFNFGCRRVPFQAQLAECHWTGYINEWDSMMVFQCLDDDIITGLYSVHDNKKEDRRYKMKCCKAVGLWAHACKFVSLNNWDAYIRYNSPIGTGIKGIVSVHDNKKEDRRYWLEVCKLAKAKK